MKGDINPINLFAEEVTNILGRKALDPKQYATENKKFAKWMGNKPL